MTVAASGSTMSQRNASATQQPLRVLHVTAPCDVGGLERVLEALTTGLARRGHELHVAAVLDRQQSAPPFLRSMSEAGVRVHRISLAHRAYLRERAEFRKLCEAIGPDVVHTHSDRPDVIDGPVARRLGIPTLSTLHGSCRMGGKARLYEWLQIRAVRRAAAVIVVSSPLGEEITSAGVAADRVHLIPNAWSPRKPLLPRAQARRELKVPDEAFLIGWVGRLIPVKGADVFVEALARLRSRTWRAVIIGDGAARSEVESLAANRGVERLSLLGSIPDAALYFSAFDAFVLSSHSEGTPITVLEAMAARVPIVATRVGGVPAMLEKTDATLVAPRDPAALAGAIANVIAHQESSAAMTERAAERLASHYSLEPWLSAHEQIYRTLAAHGTAPR